MTPLRISIPYNSTHTERVPTADREEIDQLLRQTLSHYDATNKEIQRLSIDCVSNLTTSKSLTQELSAQGPLKRSWFSFTGKNPKLQSAINRSHSHAMYANQQLLILLMEQNQSAMEFSLYLDQKQHMINLDFSEQLSQHNQDIQRICQILQRFSTELNEVVFRCGNCSSFLQRDSIICPSCGKKRTQIADQLNTDPARNACKSDLENLSHAVAQKSLTAGDSFQAAYDFVRLCDLPQQIQAQLDALYADTSAKIDALKIPKIHLLQRFQKDKLSQRDTYCSRFIKELVDIVRNEKSSIDETLDQFDHLDDQVKQLEYAVENLKKQSGGED